MAEGDEAAFTFIFNQYQGKLYSVAVDITHSPEIAEEIVQDVFLKLWLKKEKLSLVESFSGYLFIIMRKTDNIDPEAAYSGDANGLEMGVLPPQRTFGVNLSARF